MVEAVAETDGQAASGRRGGGRIDVRRVAGRSAVVGARATDPLKLLTPRRAGEAAWAYTSTYGGGLLAGDVVALDVRVDDAAAAVLATQASTKVYRSVDGSVSRQTVDAMVGAGGLLAVQPDPLQPFAASRYEQRQRFDLAADASLVLLDWYTCGRLAMGERWDFGSYVTRTEVRVGDRLVYFDAVRLDPADGPLDAPLRAGRFNCFATLVLIGPAVAAGAEAALAVVSEEPLQRDAAVLAVGSGIEGGVVLRLAGVRTETVGRYLRDLLAFLPDVLGDDPWGRKW